MIEAIDLTVRRRGRTVLDAVSFDVRPGQVTGVLGGTGAGKTMLLRRMVQLERGSGETLFDGTPYRVLRHPMREVGVLLDPGAGHPDRTVRGQLRLALATDRRAAREAVVVAETGGDKLGDQGEASGRGKPAGGEAGQHGMSVGGLEAGHGGRSPDRADAGRRGRSSGWLDSGGRGTPSGWLDSGGRGRSSGRLDVGGRGRSSGWLDSGGRGRSSDRIDAVLDIVGLTGQSRTRLADLTDGMATRLAIAVALLGDPKALLFDCPERGLEPEGVAWLGALLRAFTGQGRAALVTGSDTETLVGLADRILLLDSGYLVGTRTAEEVLRAPTGAAVIVRSPQIVRFAALLAEAGARSTQGDGACLEVRGLDRARVGDLAYRNGIPVHELSERFTGSDPADVVLAACSGRDRPIVPLQGLPEGALHSGPSVNISLESSVLSSNAVRGSAGRARGVESESEKVVAEARTQNVRLVDAAESAQSAESSESAESVQSGETAEASR